MGGGDKTGVVWLLTGELSPKIRARPSTTLSTIGEGVTTYCKIGEGEEGGKETDVSEHCVEVAKQFSEVRKVIATDE